MQYSAVLYGHGRASIREAHIYRRSTAALVPRSLSSQGTQHQAFTSWDLAARVGLSVERALPAPTCPSPANKRAPVVVPGGSCPNAARERVAKPRAGTALARAAWECLQTATESSGEIRGIRN